MHPLRKRRLLTIICVLLGLTIAAGSVLYALKQNINLYLTPSEITQAQHQARMLRLGGMVKQHSVQRTPNKLLVNFLITDFKKDVHISYNGVLPALFKEQQGVVIDGHFDGDVFIATRVLAKHDEKYMPPNIHKPI